VFQSTTDHFIRDKVTGLKTHGSVPCTDNESYMKYINYSSENYNV